MKKVMSIFCIAVCMQVIFFIDSVCSAQDIEMIGYGNASCADFSKQYNASKDIVLTSYFSWAQGYMSAINLFRATKSLTTKSFAQKDFKPEKQLSHLAAYCKENPNHTFAKATLYLFEQLPAKTTSD